MRAAADTASKELTGRMVAAIATAAQGINTGFFKDATNPLIPALASALSAIGMQNSEALVREVFAQHNDSYIKNLMGKAQQVMAHSLEVQNELAQAVASTAPVKETLPLGKPVSPQKPAAVENVISQEATASTVDDPFNKNMALALSFLGR